ncbi:hypothetical protein [Streptomyces sp. NPDC001717]|uniref:hypothetical protein n=1 Tax=Streptomyces sp. NPDC001717 TaxID=3364604 RepID=UPI00369AF276
MPTPDRGIRQTGATGGISSASTRTATESSGAAAIAHAAEHSAATLITFEDGDEHFTPGFTTRTLTGRQTVVGRRWRQPAPTLAELAARARRAPRP